MSDGQRQADLAAHVVAHHLRLFGVAAVGDGGSVRSGRKVRVLLSPSGADLAPLDITAHRVQGANAVVDFSALSTTTWARARTLHSYDWYECRRPHEVHAVDAAGRPSWLTITRGDESLLIVGTALAADLCRYRQGDPSRAANRHTEPMWGIAGERPIYLFEEQQPPGTERERQADWWSMALAQTISGLERRPRQPLLPHDAPGALVITGDDDQAYLEKYREQISLLDGLPITYFMHPLTRHSRGTIAELRSRSDVELGLHPDALDRPQAYAEIFRVQAAWFEQTFAERATLVRNHGFLNDGYWGHMPAWLEHGIRGSSNLPGINGRILNGSLLPARMAIGGELTSHWSILTAIGDGVRFALGLDGPASARCITDLAADIVASRLPGAIVVNLHPQNVSETTEMHAALHDVVAAGFVAMTLGQCIEWFAARDRQLSC